MSRTTLFRQGSHITGVSVQYSGEIAVGSGGVGGDYYLRIPSEARSELLSALAEAAGRPVPGNMTDDESRKLVIALFMALFSRTDKDPYVEIQEFLREKGVQFNGEYWPSR